jgi:hypothetical protein
VEKYLHFLNVPTDLQSVIIFETVFEENSPQRDDGKFENLNSKINEVRNEAELLHDR